MVTGHFKVCAFNQDSERTLNQRVRSVTSFTWYEVKLKTIAYSWVLAGGRTGSSQCSPPSGHLVVNLTSINSQDFIDVNLMSMIHQDLIKNCIILL